MQTIENITDARLNAVLEAIDAPEGIVLRGYILADGEQITALSDLDAEQRDDAETLRIYVEVLYLRGCDADEEIVETVRDTVEAALPGGWTADSAPLGTFQDAQLGDVSGVFIAWDYEL